MNLTEPNFTTGNLCPKCGRPYYAAWPDSIPTRGLCECYQYYGQNEPIPPNKPLEGWLCPVCGRVYAPWVASCGDPHTKTKNTNTTNIEASDD